MAKQNGDVNVENELNSSVSAMKLSTSKVAPLIGDDPLALHKITLLSKTLVNHDTSIFRFALPSSQQTLGKLVK